MHSNEFIYYVHVYVGTIDFHEFLRAIPFFLGIHDKILTEPLSIRQLHTAKVTVRQHLRKNKTFL